MDKKQFHIYGVLKSAFTHTDKNEDGSVVKSTHIISIEPDEVQFEGVEDVWVYLDEFFKGKPKKYVPNWYKEKSGIMLKSAYNIPVRIADTDERLSFDEFVERGLIRGAKINLLVNCKESALYPVALQIDADGEAYDAFANF